MANVPMNDINELWKQMGNDRSWSKFARTLREHRDKAQGIDDGLVDHLMQVADKMRNQGKSFPDSPQKLHEVLMEQTREKTISSD